MYVSKILSQDLGLLSEPFWKVEIELYDMLRTIRHLKVKCVIFAREKYF